MSEQQSKTNTKQPQPEQPQPEQHEGKKEEKESQQPEGKKEEKNFLERLFNNYYFLPNPIIVNEITISQEIKIGKEKEDIVFHVIPKTENRYDDSIDKYDVQVSVNSLDHEEIKMAIPVTNKPVTNNLKLPAKVSAPPESVQETSSTAEATTAEEATTTASAAAATSNQQ